MEKLTDPNPYDVLHLSPNADRQAIKRALANRQRENTSQVERQQALKARNLLSSVENRLLVDALTPDFTEGVDEESLIAEFGQSTVNSTDWFSLVDEKRILQQDFQAYFAAIVRHTVGDVPPPTGEIHLSSDFDGLDEFLADWLKGH